jgi:hypothetical protein
MEEKKSVALLIIGFLVLLVVASAFIPASWFGIKPVEKKYVKLNIPDANDLKVLAADNNKDGIPDWRTLMQKTYQEVEVSNPSNSGTKPDTTKMTSEVTKEDQARLEDPNNLTTSFAKNIYVATAYMKEKGITDTNAQQEMFNNILNQEASKIVIPLYSEKDLIIAKNENTSSVTTYSNQIKELAALGTKYNIGIEDIDIVNTYIKSKKSDDLKPLAAKSLKVDSLIKKMLAVSVPPSAVSIHINALNRLSAYKVTLEGLSKTDVDSVRGTLAARQYENTVSFLYKALARFDEYFKARNISLSVDNQHTGMTLGLVSRAFALYTNQ